MSDFHFCCLQPCKQMCLQQQMLLKYETQMFVSELWLFLSSLPPLSVDV
uniref:Uncharacterized protein n=1 Tax=Anguilla anguilla TaxID=7936 RepID=A0A0E9PRB5_ANGAN